MDPNGSADSDPLGQVALTVPADVGSVRVVGAVVRSWAAEAGFWLDEIETLWLAVDEAFSGLFTMEPQPNFITIGLAVGAEGVTLSVRRDVDVDPWPPQDSRIALARRVLAHLTHEVAFVKTPDGPEIRMHTWRPPAPGVDE